MSRAGKGKLRRQLAKERQSRARSAWHEAAHAITAEYFDMPVDFVTCVESVVEGKHYLGYTEMVNVGKMEVTAIRAVYTVIQGSAGSVCEWRRGTTERGSIDAVDLAVMSDTVEALKLTEKVTHIFNITEGILEWSWDVVSDVAALLLAQGRIEGDIVREMVRPRLGYIPAENQIAGLFEGAVIRPESEASKRAPLLQ